MDKNENEPSVWDELPEDEFVLKFPVYSYVLGCGPHPGFLRDPGKDMTFVPLWSDSDLFQTYMERSGLSTKASARPLKDAAELVAFLGAVKASTELIRHVVVDPNAKAPQVMSVWEIDKFIATLREA